MADDWTFTDSDGSVETKAQTMADIKSGALTFESATVDDMSVRGYGTAAVVIGRTMSKGQYKGQGFNDTERFTDVFVKRRGRWQAVATQSTGIAQH